MWRSSAAAGGIFCKLAALGFFSAKLEAAQLSYRAFDRELYAIFVSIRHFRHHLEGRRFTVWTNHKPLTFALSCMSGLVDSKTTETAVLHSRIQRGCRPGVQAPQAVPASGPATLAGVKVPSGSMAVSQEAGGTAGAPHYHLMAVVTAKDGVDLELLARDQSSCPSIQQLRTNSSLALHVSTVGKQQL